MKNITIDFKKLVEEKKVNVWEKGNKKRYYLAADKKSYIGKANPFFSETKDNGKYEEEFQNGYLYLEKTYNNFDGLVAEIIEIIK